MASITEALGRVKGDPARILKPEHIKAACIRAGHRWRERSLGPVQTVHAMAEQALHGNTPIGEVVRLHHGSFTGPAFCRARKRLPLEVVLSLFHEQHRWVKEKIIGSCGASALWRGHRTWLMDGASFSMPDTPGLQEYFGQSKRQRPGCGFPVCSMLVRFDWHTALLLDFIPAPLSTGEGGLAALTHATMQAGDIVVADSNFGTFGQVALLRGRDVHTVCQVHAGRAMSFGAWADRPGAQLVKRVGKNDQIVRWFKPKECPPWMAPAMWAQLPESILVREVRRSIHDPGGRRREVTLVTTLLDEKTYPAAALVALYARRWRIEDWIRTLKHTLKLDVARCKSVHGVLKELAVIALVYNMVRMVMLEAARRQKVAPDRISFIDALRWWRWAGPDEPVPKLRVNPLRPGRHEPRVQKRRPKAYPMMIEPRAVLKARLLADGKRRRAG